MEYYQPGWAYRTSVRIELADGSTYGQTRRLIFWHAVEAAQERDPRTGTPLIHAIVTWSENDDYEDYGGTPMPSGEPFRIVIAPDGWRTVPAGPIVGHISGYVGKYVPRDSNANSTEIMSQAYQSRIPVLQKHRERRTTIEQRR